MSLIQFLRVELPWITLCAILGRYTGTLVGAEDLVAWAIAYSFLGGAVAGVIWWWLSAKHIHLLQKQEEKDKEDKDKPTLAYVEETDVPVIVAKTHGFTQFKKSEYSKTWESFADTDEGLLNHTILHKVRKYINEKEESHVN